MKDSALLKLALIIGLIGLIGLFLLSRNMIVPSRIRLTPGDEISIQGKIVGKSIRGNIEVLKIEEKRQIDVVIFDTSGFIEGDIVDVLGKVDEYDGKVQVIADQITLEEISLNP